MKKDCDVLIIGGGPAGVSCAITVAQFGYNVVILDKKKRHKIGDKTCGDAIDKEALVRLKNRIGVDFPNGNELSDNISKMSIAANDIDLKITLDAPGYLVDRLNYGQRLLQEAEKLGVKIISSAPVRGIITETIENEIYLSGVNYFHENQKKSITAKFTIDASGAYAAIRKVLPDAMLVNGMKKALDDDELWPTYREIIKLNNEVTDHRWQEEIVLLFDDEYPPPGYFWIFSKGKGMLNIGIGWEKTQELGKLKERMKEELDKHYTVDQYEVIKRGGGQIPFRPPFDTLVFNGGALAGDAGNLVHPITAEGHGPALDTGSILGKTLISALENGKQNKEELWNYNVAVARHYGRKHMEAQILKEFLRDIGAKGLCYLIKKKVFREDELNLIFSGGALELTLRQKIMRVLTLVPRPRIMLKLKGVLSATEKSREIYMNYPLEPSKLNEWRKIRNSALNINF